MKPWIVALMVAAIMSLPQMGMADEWSNTTFNYTYREYFPSVYWMEGSGIGNLSIYLPGSEIMAVASSGKNGHELASNVHDAFKMQNLTVVVGTVNNVPFVIGQQNGEEGIYFLGQRPNFFPKGDWQECWRMLNSWFHPWFRVWMNAD